MVRSKLMQTESGRGLVGYFWIAGGAAARTVYIAAEDDEEERQEEEDVGTEPAAVSVHHLLVLRGEVVHDGVLHEGVVAVCKRDEPTLLFHHADRGPAASTRPLTACAGGHLIRLLSALGTTVDGDLCARCASASREARSIGGGTQRRLDGKWSAPQRRSWRWRQRRRRRRCRSWHTMVAAGAIGCDHPHAAERGTAGPLVSSYTILHHAGHVRPAVVHSHT